MQDRIKTLFYVLLSYAAVRRCVESLPYVGKKVPPGQRTHVFDREYGIDTSGALPQRLIVSDKTLQTQISPYFGSQPRAVRAALQSLGVVDEYTFVDLGCGKGRVMVIASEFPFRGIVGIELSKRLAKTARSNTANIGRRFPSRPRFAVIEGNAATVQLPEGNLVIFIYHSFGALLLAPLIKRLETTLTLGTTHIFFVYYNPVHGDILDNSPAFTRWYADDLGVNEAVVIWQTHGARSVPTPHANSNRGIVIVDPLWHAGLAAAEPAAIGVTQGVHQRNG